MNPGIGHARRTAGVAAALLIVLGALLGITLDRTLLGRASAAAAAPPLTLDAMVRELELDSVVRARVRERLDRLDVSVTRAAEQGLDSLRAVARRARAEVEEALPADRRQHFRNWMDHHRDQMMRRMGGGMHEPGHGMMSPARRNGTR